jgi:hypothetical protein
VVLFLVVAKDFLFSTESRPVLGPTQSPIQWVLEAVSPRVKRPRREAGAIPPTSAEVKNGKAIPLLPYESSWRGAYLIKHSDNFIFTLAFAEMK